MDTLAAVHTQRKFLPSVTLLWQKYEDWVRIVCGVIPVSDWQHSDRGTPNDAAEPMCSRRYPI